MWRGGSGKGEVRSPTKRLDNAKRLDDVEQEKWRRIQDNDGLFHRFLGVQSRILELMRLDSELNRRNKKHGIIKGEMDQPIYGVVGVNQIALRGQLELDY